MNDKIINIFPKFTYAQKNNFEEKIKKLEAKGKTKEDKDAFSSVDDIWISRQLINPVEVAVVANKVNKELLNLDFIKVRYPRGYSRCRLLRSFDYKTCTATDVELMTETGEKLDDEEV